jgi:hypothetical protein
MRRFVRPLLLLAPIVGVAAELTARLDDQIRYGIPFASTPDSRDLTIVDSLGTRGRPRARYKGWHLNNYGFRGPDISAQPARGCTRVMVLGASETFGYYETPGKEYPAQLGDSLHDAGCFEVINAAVAGMGLRQQVSMWENYASRFQPDYVVIYPTPLFYLRSDAPTPSTGVIAGAPPEPSVRPRLIERVKDVIEVPRPIQRQRILHWIAAETTGRADDWFFRTPPAERLDLFIRDLDRLVTAVRARGAIPVLATHAMRFSIPPNPDDEFMLLAWRQYTPRARPEAMLAFEMKAAERMREYAAGNHIALIDIARRMTGHREQFADFIHFTNEGAAVVAGEMANDLRRMSGLAARRASPDRATVATARLSARTEH